MITRKEYMADSANLFSEYYAQFITESTKRFILNNIGLEKLKKSKDAHFNDIIKHSNGGAGGWIWDNTPVNMPLVYELGETTKGHLPSQCFHTCVGKEAARRLLEAEAGAGRIGVKVTFESGNSFETEINLTLEEARAYYFGASPLNVGRGEYDHFEKVVSVELAE